MTVSTKTARTPPHAAHKSGALSPREQDDLWDMEEHFWTSGADNARATTATNAVMIFPYPPGILQGDQIWAHLRRGTGWRSVIMAERRVTRHRDIAILSYRASAEKPTCRSTRRSAPPHTSTMTTWLRISHQQTIVT
jgi:hypothetical protein